MTKTNNWYTLKIVEDYKKMPIVILIPSPIAAATESKAPFLEGGEKFPFEV